MSNIKNKIRKLTAAKISNVENAEIFAWDKWLRMPSWESKEIRPLFSKLDKTDKIDLNILSPDTTDYKISLSKVKTFKSSHKIYSFKTRSNLVFFQFGKTSSYNVPVKFSNELKQIFSAVIVNEKNSVLLKVDGRQKKPTDRQLNPAIMNFPVNISYLTKWKNGKNFSTRNIDFGFHLAEPKDHINFIKAVDPILIDYNISAPAVIDYLSRLLPKVYKISLLNTFEEIKSGLNNFLIKVDLLDNIPGTYTASFENISRADIYSYHFKNEICSSVDKKIYIEKLSPLNVHFNKIYFPELLSEERTTISSSFKNFNQGFNTSVRNFSASDSEEFYQMLQPKTNRIKETKKFKLENLVANKSVPKQTPDQSSGIERIDNWIDLDKDQKLEYDQEFFHAQNQIWDIYQTGNPYRLQAKVFTLMHQLKQILNFPSKANASIKSNILLEQIFSMRNSNQKAVVFSQYDKFGSQKLSEIFNNADIKYISCLPGTPQNELEAGFRKFEKDETITVLLIAAKALPAKVQLRNFNTVIHFDQWWVPVSQWQLEDKLINGNKPPLKIINYFTKDTIDVSIKSKLDEYGLLNKNIVETIGADSFSKLLNENDWFDMFRLQPDKKNKELNEKISFVDFLKLPEENILEKINLLLTNLGFRNVSYDNKSEDQFFRLKAGYQKKGQLFELAAFYFYGDKPPDHKSIQNLVNGIPDAKTGKVFIISLNKDFNNQQKTFPENISLIDAQTLFNYLRVFRLI